MWNSILKSLSNCEYDSCLFHLNKFKDLHVQSLMKRWIQAEMDYTSMNYLKSKMFKQSHLINTFAQLEKEFGQNHFIQTTLEEDLLHDILLHLQLRSQLSQLYLTLSYTKALNESIPEKLKELKEQFMQQIQKDIVLKITKNELFMLEKLIKLEIVIREYNLNKTCVYFNSAVKTFVEYKSTTKTTVLCKWFGYWISKMAIKSKLYFRQLYRPQQMPSDKNELFTDIFSHFIEKNGPGCKIVLMYKILPGKSFQEDGYSCFTNQTPTGIKSFPCLLSYPEEFAPLYHWPNIISIIQSNDFEIFLKRKYQLDQVEYLNSHNTKERSQSHGPRTSIISHSIQRSIQYAYKLFSFEGKESIPENDQTSSISHDDYRYHGPEDHCAGDRDANPFTQDNSGESRDRYRSYNGFGSGTWSYFTTSPKRKRSSTYSIPFYSFFDSKLNVTYQMDYIDHQLMLICIHEQFTHPLSSSSAGMDMDSGCHPQRSQSLISSQTPSIVSMSKTSSALSSTNADQSHHHCRMNSSQLIDTTSLDEKKKEVMHQSYLKMRDRLLEICQFEQIFSNFILNDPPLKFSFS